MITIMHGEDIVSSRKFYIDEKQKSSNPTTFSGDNLNLTDLAQAIEGNSLFDIVNKEIFIEDFFSKKNSREFDNIIGYLQKHSRNVNIKIWESKEVSKKQLNSLKNTTIKLFSLPKSLFLFLNKLAPQNHKLGQNDKNLIYLFHKTLESTGVELVFYMLIRQFRLLLAISQCHPEPFDYAQDKLREGSGDSSSVSQRTQNDIGNIDEIKNMQAWQKERLTREASVFSEMQLKNIYKKIYSIEVSQKTGTSPLSLPQAIDFLLLSI